MSKDLTTKKTIQTMTGTVVSSAPAKTVVVEVKTQKRHAKYHKSYSVVKKYHAHDEKDEYVVGDTVVITPSRPYSKLKKFVVLKKA